MIGGKMVGTVLASMIADIKRVSQVFRGFKSGHLRDRLRRVEVKLELNMSANQIGFRIDN